MISAPEDTWSSEEGSVSRSHFGNLPDGTPIALYRLRQAGGFQLEVMEWGAAIRSLKVPLKDGTIQEVVLGFEDLDDYMASYALPDPPYFGAIVGRCAGRISQAGFELNGRPVQLEANWRQHHLHGGRKGFSRAIWTFKEAKAGPEPMLTLGYRSLDGEDGYPGQVDLTVTYILHIDRSLSVDMKAVTDAPTILNLTQHSYFNLEGPGADVRSHEMQLSAACLLETGGDQIPTGRMQPVSTAGLDFRKPALCPDAIDHSFDIRENKGPQARLLAPRNGLSMNIYTNQPCLHVYIGGDCHAKIPGRAGVQYHAQSGICFETQHFPDSPHHPNFPSVELLPEETYHHYTRFTFQT